MEKTISVLEISDTQVRLAVGYEKDGKVNLIHIAERPINGLISRGEILDFQTLASIINSMREFKDETTKEKITITDITLVLPSFGLNVFQSTKTTNVVSPYSLIATIDIENVVSLVQKEAIPGGSEIVDIIPDAFVLEMGRSFVNPPINEKSNSMTIKAKIYTLPSLTITSYKKVCEAARLKVKRMCVSSYALSELAKADPDIPHSYILVDVGAQISNITLVGNNSPFETISFPSGASDLIKRVVDTMSIPYDDALELLRKYGFDERPLTYKPIIAESTVDGITRKFDPNALNLIIKQFLFEEYFTKFDVAFETLMKGYPNTVRNFPIVLAGGLTRTFGFENIAKQKFASNSSILYLEPKCIGGRDMKYSAVVGAIYAGSKYKGALSDTRQKTTELLRARDEN